MCKILVTGGLGTVGHVLVRELAKRGHDVWICDLPHHHEEKYIRCDIASFAQLSRIFDNHNFDYVYNLAAEFGRWNGEDYYDTLWRTNAVGTKNLIRFQERFKFKLIHFSSSEVYGDYDGVMAEDVMETHEIRQLNDYAISKWVNELQIMNSAAMHGTESVRVRLFNTYGPGEYYSPYRSVICLFIYRALHGIPYNVYLNHNRTSSYVTDTVNTLSNIIDNFIPGEVYNIGGTEFHDIKTVSDMILKCVGRDDSIVSYLEGEPFTTKDKRIDCSRAVRDLKHNPVVTLEDGITRTVQWMKGVYFKEEIL
ncbi:MAG: NAD-dependent epimerase/dehydratase family protein [Thermodesulfobacteriota bacterium]